MENDPINPKVDINKKGKEFAEKNEEIKYEFEIKNNSNTDLDELTWYDYLPADKTRITKIMTGTYNENINYYIYYKTNINDYKLLKVVNSFNNEYISLDGIELLKDEIITELKIEFGKVSKDFSSVTKPNIFVKVNSNVKKGDEILNKTELIGIKDAYRTKDEDCFKTVIKEKEVIKKLPKTGC